MRNAMLSTKEKSSKQFVEILLRIFILIRCYFELFIEFGIAINVILKNNFNLSQSQRFRAKDFRFYFVQFHFFGGVVWMLNVAVSFIRPPPPHTFTFYLNFSNNYYKFCGSREWGVGQTGV